MATVSGGYGRSIAVTAVIVVALVFALTPARVELWEAALPLFEWMETTWFGVIGKTWGAAFAAIEAIHLLAMAVLGGSVLVSDGRLLGVVFRDVPILEIAEPCHRLWRWALVVVMATGVFMACGVALKVYYLNVFWYKMLALATGVAFAQCIRMPLLRTGADQLSPRLLQLVAIASLMLWFSVAATGRWIGFSG